MYPVCTGARLVAEREQACDEHVVAESGEPLAYAEGIVTICRRYVENPLMSVAVSAVPTSRPAPMRLSPIGSA